MLGSSSVDYMNFSFFYHAANKFCQVAEAGGISFLTVVEGAEWFSGRCLEGYV